MSTSMVVPERDEETEQRMEQQEDAPSAAAIDIQREMREMAKMLNILKKGTKTLLKNDENGDDDFDLRRNPAKQRMVTLEDKRARSNSAWAKSTTSSHEIPGFRPKSTPGTTATGSILDIGRASSAVRRRAPAFSMGSKLRSEFDDQRPTTAAATGSEVLVTHDDMLSTRKRPRSAHFGPNPTNQTSQTPTVAPRTLAMDHPFEGRLPAEEMPNQQFDVIEVLLPTRDAYSFGKSDRFPKQHQNTDKIEDLGDDLLNPGNADKWVRPRSQAALMTGAGRDRDTARDTQPQRQLQSDTAPADRQHREREEENAGEMVLERGDENEIPPKGSQIESLSNRFRAPHVSMRPSSAPVNKAAIRGVAEPLVPGPGAYDMPSEFDKIRPKTGPPPPKKNTLAGGEDGLPPAASTTAEREQELRRAEKRSGSKNLGPGHYDVAKSFDKTKPSIGTKGTPLYRPETKLNPHLAKKRYFEQKAQDARDVHDHFLPTKDAAVTRRTPTAMLAPPKCSSSRSSSSRPSSPGGSKGVFRAESKLDPEIRKILSTVPKNPLSKDASLPLNIKHDFVEKRAPAPVNMGTEVLARQKTEEALRNKPGVARAVSEKKGAMLPRDRYYGPQLHIPWTRDKPSMQWTSGNGPDYPKEGEDDGEISPSEEVKAILARRNGQSAVNEKQGTLSHRSMENDSYTDAFLKSSFSGSLYKRPPAANLEHSKPYEDPEEARKRKQKRGLLDKTYADFEFAGPELQPQWAPDPFALRQEEGLSAVPAVSRYKAPVVRMDLGKGREQVKVPSKGQVITTPFDTIKKDNEGLAGPGVYENADAHTKIGGASNPVKGGVLAFDKVIAREDAVGPFGERPEAAKNPIPLQDGEGDLYFEDVPGMGQGRVLDIDLAEAFDRAKGRGKRTSATNIPLYDKERYPKEKRPSTPEVEHVGGAWFKGMHKEVLARPSAALLYDKMTGRSARDRDAEAQRVDDELMREIIGDAPMEAGSGQHVLDLEIKDYNPSMPRAAVATIADPQRYPRFPPEKKSKQNKKLTKSKGKKRDPGESGEENGDMGQEEGDDDEEESDYVPLQPNYEAVSTKQRAVGGVRMDRMTGRGDAGSKQQQDLDQEVILQEIEGAVPLSARQEAARERDDAMQRGTQALSTHKRTLVPAGLNMSKQPPRHLSLATTTTAAATDKPKTDDNRNENGNKNLAAAPDFAENPVVSTKKRVKGAMDWNAGSVGRSREEDRAREIDILKSEFPEVKFSGIGEAQLDLADPDPDAALLSRQKRMQSGPSWDTQGGEKAQRFPKTAAEKAGPQQDLPYVDPGKFKAGGAGFGEVGAGPGVSSMANQSERPGADAKIAEERLMNEQLWNEFGIARDPRDPQAGAIARGTSDLGVAAGDAPSQQRRTPGVSAMVSAVPRVPSTAAQHAQAELDSDYLYQQHHQQEQQLDTDTTAADDARSNRERPRAASFAPKEGALLLDADNRRVKLRAERLAEQEVEEELGIQNGNQLDLNLGVDADRAMRKRVPGGATIAKSSGSSAVSGGAGRSKSRAEELAEASVNREIGEGETGGKAGHLDLDTANTYDESSRKGSRKGNLSGMASRTERGAAAGGAGAGRQRSKREVEAEREINREFGFAEGEIGERMDGDTLIVDGIEGAKDFGGKEGNGGKGGAVAMTSGVDRIRSSYEEAAAREFEEVYGVPPSGGAGGAGGRERLVLDATDEADNARRQRVFGGALPRSGRRGGAEGGGGVERDGVSEREIEQWMTGETLGAELGGPGENNDNNNIEAHKRALAAGGGKGAASMKSRSVKFQTPSDLRAEEELQREIGQLDSGNTTGARRRAVAGNKDTAQQQAASTRTGSTAEGAAGDGGMRGGAGGGRVRVSVGASASERKPAAAAAAAAAASTAAVRPAREERGGSAAAAEGGGATVTKKSVAREQQAPSSARGSVRGSDGYSRSRGKSSAAAGSGGSGIAGIGERGGIGAGLVSNKSEGTKRAEQGGFSSASSPSAAKVKRSKGSARQQQQQQQQHQVVEEEPTPPVLRAPEVAGRAWAAPPPHQLGQRQQQQVEGFYENMPPEEMMQQIDAQLKKLDVR